MALLCCAAGARAEPEPDRTPPTNPGIHHLSFDWQPPRAAWGDADDASRGGAGERDEAADAPPETERMTYGLFIPDRLDEAEARGEKVPLLVYLCGAGMRGHTDGAFNNNGPIAEMRRNEHLAPKLDCLIVQPQLHRDARWENARMGGYVADVARRVMERYPVDPDRVYLAGMSMGGEGVWHAAKAAPDLYTLVLSMAGRQHPQPEKLADALGHATVWIIVGSGDGQFTAGSRVMRKAFEAEGVEVVYKEMSGYGHNIWRMFWNKPALYEAMMRYGRGTEGQRRPGVGTLEAIAESPPPNPAYARFSEALQKQFERFRPWWQIENCRMSRATGMRDKWGGRGAVLATLPFNRHHACRLMTTAKVPKGKKTTLVLEVAAEGRPWLLQVEGDNRRLLRTMVEPTEQGGSPWRTVEVDLTRFAGEKVFLEVLHPAHRGTGVGYWGGIEVVSE